MQQPTLNLILPRVQIKAAEMMDRFLDVLADGRWHRAKDLSLQLHTSDRVIRMMAERSDGRVISGNEGYKLTYMATPEDMKEYTGRQWSQIHHTKARIERTEKQWHSRNQGGRAA